MPDPFLALAGGDLLDRAAAHDRARLLFQYVLVAQAAGFIVLGFDEQPVLVALTRPRAHAHQMPAAAELGPIEIENEMALGVALVRIPFGSPAPAIPDHHRAAAIFAFRNGAFERVVFDRMILDVNGETLFVGIETGAARNRPALHHAVEFEPQIVVQSARGVLLNHIAVTAAGAFAPARFGRHAELPLFPVGFESHERLTHAFGAGSTITAAHEAEKPSLQGTFLPGETRNPAQHNRLGYDAGSPVRVPPQAVTAQIAFPP